MKTLAAVWVALMMAAMVAPVQGGDDLQVRRAFFEEAIAKEIASCQHKGALQFSSSYHLRLKGHREASKALFLSAHREQLVDQMTTSTMEAKDYRVDRFLNDQFNCGCYANWAAK